MKNRFSILKNSLGFSLVEVLVTLSLMSIMAVVGGLGVTYLYSARLSKTIISEGDLHSTMGKILGGGKCFGNFNKAKITNTNSGEANKGIGTLNELRDSFNTLIKEKGLFHNDLEIQKIKLKREKTDTSSDLSTGDPFAREVVVYFKRKRVGSYETTSRKTCPDGSGCNADSDCTGGATGSCTEKTTCTNGNNPNDQAGCYFVKCSIEIEWNAGTETPLGETKSCSYRTCHGSLPAGIGGGSGNVDCYYAKEGDNKTLIGCRSDATKNNSLETVITGSGNTALGFDAGSGSGANNVFIGQNAGKNNAGGEKNVFVGRQTGVGNIDSKQNVYIGFRAGMSSNASKNIFIGHTAGQCVSGGQNTFVGFYSGRALVGGDSNFCPGTLPGTGTDNTFIGYKSGEANTSGANNVFIGSGAGVTNTTGSKNMFLGKDAGKNNLAGDDNTFIGNTAGEDNTNGNRNVFIGFESGQENIRGSANVFIGRWAGQKNQTSGDNVFIGYEAGVEDSGGNNTFVGSNAGKNTKKNTTVGSASNNTFVGRLSGDENTTGSDNIFIGKEAGKHNKGGVTKTGNRQLNIGNLIFGKMPSSAPTTNFFDEAPTEGGVKKPKYLAKLNSDDSISSKEGIVINGDLYVEGKIYKDCESGTCKQALYASNNILNNNLYALNSSRVFKKNIKPYTEYRKSLEDLVKTPLFTYQYKNNLPKKTRMGIIAEELPQHLQIKGKNHPTKPDWVSIYGHLWAGIKALHEELNDFITAVLKKFNTLSGKLDKIWIAITGLQNVDKDMQVRFEKLETQVTKLKTKVNTLEKQNKTLKDQLSINKNKE